jgi:hypothetical protein
MTKLAEGTVEKADTHISVVRSPIPAFGTKDFFHILRLRNISIMTGKDDGATWAVVDALKVNLKIVEYTIAGKTIDDAVRDYPDSAIIINGAMFSPKGVPPPKTFGVLCNQGIRLWTSLSAHSAAEARLLETVKLRFSFGQTSGNGIVSYKIGRNIPPIRSLVPLTYVSGLFSFIISNVAQTPEDDKDLAKFFGFFYKWRGIGIVGLCYEYEYIIVYVRTGKAPTEADPKDSESIQKMLITMGINDALLVDGGSSVALAINGVVQERGGRHDDPSLKETVTNYMVFHPK